jgi:hypothetical protein
MPLPSSFFLVDVVPVPDILEGTILIEISGQDSSPGRKEVRAAQKAGNQQWPGRVFPDALDLVPRPCTCDLKPLPEADYKDDLIRAWVVAPELRRHIHLS